MIWVRGVKVFGIDFVACAFTINLVGFWEFSTVLSRSKNALLEVM